MDKEYWTEYYKKNLAPVLPTKFAQDILPELQKGKNILDIGCGNGRDSIYFSQNDISVTAIDQAESMIKKLKNDYEGSGITFIANDFIEENDFETGSFDYLYSRFTIHAITEDEEIRLIKKAYKILKKDGMFFIEVRSIHDELFGKGQKVARNAFIYDNHFRRFVKLEEIINHLEAEGFEILEKEQGRDFAAFKEENPIVIRIKAMRRE